MSLPPIRRPLDVFDELVIVADRDVADIGCGRGGLVRALAERGARATGIDCGDAALAAARASAIGDESYLEGAAQSLPLADASQDVVLFVNSLHHVPVADQPLALREAARVLRPGGRAYVEEPLAEGPYFEMVRPLDDETEVRAAAYAALKAADDFTELSETVYLNSLEFAGFEDFRDRFVAVDPEVRGPLFAVQEQVMATRFLRYADREAGAYRLRQPQRVILLQHR